MNETGLLSTSTKGNRVPTLTSAVNAAADKNRPSGDKAAIVFLSWFVSTVPTHFPLAANQSLMSVPET